MAKVLVNISENIAYQDLSNDVTYVGLSETFVTSTYLRV